MKDDGHAKKRKTMKKEVWFIQKLQKRSEEIPLSNYCRKIITI